MRLHIERSENKAHHNVNPRLMFDSIMEIIMRTLSDTMVPQIVSLKVLNEDAGFSPQHPSFSSH